MILNITAFITKIEFFQQQIFKTSLKIFLNSKRSEKNIVNNIFNVLVIIFYDLNLW
jgi:hypothetical protein